MWYLTAVCYICMMNYMLIRQTGNVKHLSNNKSISMMIRKIVET